MYLMSKSVFFCYCYYYVMHVGLLRLGPVAAACEAEMKLFPCLNTML
jgi:hypothetical protein